MRRNQPRHHSFEIDPEARQAAIAQVRADFDAAERRFAELETQLLRKMPADHAALKAIVREMRECRLSAWRLRGELAQAWAIDDCHSNRFSLPLRDLIGAVKTAEYRYDHTRKRDKPYIDFVLSFARDEVKRTNALLLALLHSPAMRIRSDERKAD